MLCAASNFYLQTFRRHPRQFSFSFITLRSENRLARFLRNPSLCCGAPSFSRRGKRQETGLHADGQGNAKGNRRRGGHRDRGAVRRPHAGACRRRHDQGRNPSFALGNDGDFRDDAQRRHADAHRGAEQEGWAARQAARGRGRRPGVGLAALRREGARADHRQRRRRRLRLLDFGVAEIRAAGLRGTEQPPFLSRAVRGRGEPAQHLLYRRRAEPAGDSRPSTT